MVAVYVQSVCWWGTYAVISQYQNTKLIKFHPFIFSFLCTAWLHSNDDCLLCPTFQLFCSVVAGLLHYFFLAAFAWMCIEGIHLYLIVVGVIYNKGFLHRNFYIFGYGSPAVVVTISAALGYKYYGTSTV